MWHQVLIGASNVLAQMRAESRRYSWTCWSGSHLSNTCASTSRPTLAYIFGGVQVEGYVVLSPYLPLFVNDDPDTQGRVENFLGRCAGYLPELKLAGSGSIFLAVTVVDNLCPFFLETELEPPCTRCVRVGRKMVEEIDLVFDLNEGSLQTS